MSKRVLGLDLGCSSIGWALLKVPDSDDEEGEVTALGVRVFPDAAENEKGRVRTRNTQRRMARLARRTRWRRRLRKKHVKSLLREAGLWPAEGSPALKAILETNPIQLRAEALDRKLEPYELGRVLYHLCQRRGFKSNAKGGIEKGQAETAGKKTGTGKHEDDDPKKLEAKMAQLEGEMGDRTLGQFLYAVSKNYDHAKGLEKEKTRGFWRAKREMYRQEFERIWAAQKPYYQSILTEDEHGLKDKVAYEQNGIFHQRPYSLPPDHPNYGRQIGYCECIPNEKRCHKYHWAAQQFIMLKQIGDLQIRTPKDGCSRTLKNAQKMSLRDALLWRTSMPLKEAHSLLGLDKDEAFNFDFEAAKRKPRARPKQEALEQEGRKEKAAERKLQGNKFGSGVAHAIGRDRAQLLGEEELIALSDAWILAQEPDDFVGAVERVALRFGWSGSRAWSAQEARTLFGYSELRDGHLRLSLEAVKALLPYLGNGECPKAFLDEYGAREAAGYERRTWARQPRLPPPHTVVLKPQHPLAAGEPQPLYPRLVEGKPLGDSLISCSSNPVVQKSLWEVRKLVNALLEKYGRPDEIVVELARDARMMPKQREKYLSLLLEREGERIDARKKLAEWGRPSSESNIRRYRLWLEMGGCNARCPYTGDSLASPGTFLDPTLVEVDHILPISRSSLDSYDNLVLCAARANRARSDQLPSEMANHGDILQRVEKWHENKSLSDDQRRAVRARIEKFDQKTVDLAGFLSRQLNDTRYISRVVRKYLRVLYDPDSSSDDPNGTRAVRATRGGITSMLRKIWWGPKERSDHRHHAADAIMIALAPPDEGGFIRRLQTCTERRRDGLPRLDFPWLAFPQEARAKWEGIIVSHKPSRKLSGPLHKEMFFGLARRETEGRIAEARVPRAKRPAESVRVYVSKCTLTDFAKAFNKTKAKLQQAKLREIRYKRIRELFSARCKEQDGKLFADAAQFTRGSNNPLRLPANRAKLAANPSLQGTAVYSIRLLHESAGMVPLEARKMRSEERVPLSSLAGNTEAREVRYAEPGSNHHVSIFELPRRAAGRPRQYAADFVTMFRHAERVMWLAREAKKTKHQPEPHVSRTHPQHPGAHFRMSLSMNEMLRLPNSFLGLKNAADGFSIWRVRMLTKGKIHLLLHTYAGRAKQAENRVAARQISPADLMKVIDSYLDSTPGHKREMVGKVSVDPLGRVSEAND